MFERPKNLSSVIGQTDIIKRIKISIESCQTKKTVFPHSLLFGPPGYGKTSISSCVANELNKPILIANGAGLKTIKELLPYLPKIKGGIFFVDEVHRMSSINQEFCYNLLEDFFYCLGGDKIKLDIEPFTFIGGTTNLGALLKPFRDRCTFQYSLVAYSLEELSEIVKKNATQNKFILDDNCSEIIAKSSRGCPRTALSRLKWIMDFAVSKNTTIAPQIIKSALNLAKISDNGMEQWDRDYLSILKKSQPISLSSLSSALNVDSHTIKEVIEPFLIQNNLIKVTTKGRVLIC